MNISRENETNNIESELKRRIKQWAEQEGLEVPKDFEQIAISLREKGIDADSTVNYRKGTSITPR